MLGKQRQTERERETGCREFNLRCPMILSGGGDEKSDVIRLLELVHVGLSKANR